MVNYLTVEQRCFIVKRYLETKNCAVVLNEFRERFPNRDPPNRATIFKNVRKYETFGTSQNRHKGNSGRRRTARTPENIDAVRGALQNVQNQGNVSCRRNTLGMDKSTFQRIVKKDLNWHPFKIHIRHKLLETDYPRRIRFCNWFIARCNNPRFLYNIVVGDEASFSLNGKVSTQNVRMYAPKGEAPSFNFDVQCSRQKVSVWAGICGNGTLVGPYFFPNNVNGRSYLEMLENFVFPCLFRNYNIQNINDGLGNLWWIQDGAPAHRTRNVRGRLVDVFGQQAIGIGFDTEWPARSPDLTPCDFFLWGYLKHKVFLSQPENLNILRQRITNEMEELRRNPNFLRNSITEMRHRAEKCIQRNGRHVEGVL